MGSLLLASLLFGAAALVLVGLPEPQRPVVASPPGAIPWGRLSVALLPLGLLVLSGPAAAALGGLTAVAGGRVWRRRAQARAQADERSGSVEALSVLSSELRAGRPPTVALAVAASVAAGPFALALQAAAGSDRVGADPIACMLRGVSGSAVPEVLRGLAACWQVCASTGSSLAAAVERLTESLRAQQAQLLVVEAELAGPRATAGLLAVLPLAGIALAAGLGADPLRVLLHTPVGLGCLTGGIGLDLLGLWWTRRLVAGVGVP